MTPRQIAADLFAHIVHTPFVPPEPVCGFGHEGCTIAARQQAEHDAELRDLIGQALKAIETALKTKRTIDDPADPSDVAIEDWSRLLQKRLAKMDDRVRADEAETEAEARLRAEQAEARRRADKIMEARDAAAH